MAALVTHEPMPRGHGRDLRPCIYVVHWGHVGIVKVGFSGDWRERTGAYVTRGGELRSLTFFDSVESAFGAEILAMETLWQMCTAAFAKKAEAASLLGRRGSGYSECALVHTDLIDGLVSTIERKIR